MKETTRLLRQSIEIPSAVQGLIFDCDGTLVDSMPLHMEAWEYVIQKAGADFNFDFFFSKKGMNETAIVELYNTTYRTSFDCNEIVAAKQRYVLAHIDSITPIDVVVDVVKRYHNKLPMSVVSGSVREIVERELTVIGIRDYFCCIISGDDPFPQKPEPDMFLEAARRMNVPPERCQVFEDGDAGLLAAQRAGMLATDIRNFLE